MKVVVRGLAGLTTPGPARPRGTRLSHITRLFGKCQVFQSLGGPLETIIKNGHVMILACQ